MEQPGSELNESEHWVTPTPLPDVDVTEGQRTVRLLTNEYRAQYERVRHNGRELCKLAASFFRKVRRIDAVRQDARTGRTLRMHVHPWVVDWITTHAEPSEEGCIRKFDGLWYHRGEMLEPEFVFDGGDKPVTTFQALQSLVSNTPIHTAGWRQDYYEQRDLVLGSGGLHRSLACLLAGYGNVRLPRTRVFRPGARVPEWLERGVEMVEANLKVPLGVCSTAELGALEGLVNAPADDRELLWRCVSGTNLRLESVSCLKLLKLVDRLTSIEEHNGGWPRWVRWILRGGGESAQQAAVLRHLRRGGD